MRTVAAVLAAGIAVLATGCSSEPPPAPATPTPSTVTVTTEPQTPEDDFVSEARMMGDFSAVPDDHELVSWGHAACADLRQQLLESETYLPRLHYEVTAGIAGRLAGAPEPLSIPIVDAAFTHLCPDDLPTELAE